MNKVLVINFSPSEYAMHTPVFKALFPSSPFEFCNNDALYDKEISSDDRAVVGCNADENSAMNAIFYLKEKRCPVTLFCERKPSVLFLNFVRKQEYLSLLLCPESIDEVRQCGECIARGNRYVSKVAQDNSSVRSLGRFLDYESLSEMNKELMFSVFEGLSLKETALLTRKSLPYVQTSLSRLKERFSVLEKRELFVAMMKWIGLSDRISQSG